MGYLYLCVSTGLQTRPQRQRVTAKARLRNGHTLREGGVTSPGTMRPFVRILWPLVTSYPATKLRTARSSIWRCGLARRAWLPICRSWAQIENPDFMNLKNKIKFVNFTAFWKCPLSFISKFSTLTLTEKLLPHFTVTETLNSDKSDSNHCYSESESATAHCSHSTVLCT